MNANLTEQVAAWYNSARHDPKNPTVRRAYGQLNNYLSHMFRAVKASVEVIPVSANPYGSLNEMTQQVCVTRKLYIWMDNGDLPNDHPLARSYRNTLFRAVHDFIHIGWQNDFTFEGELANAKVEFGLAPVAAWPALFTETVGQLCAVAVNGKFPSQKAIVPPPALLRDVIAAIGA